MTPPFLLLAGSIALAAAQAGPPDGKPDVAGWTFLADRSTCTASMRLEGGTVLDVTYDPAANGAALLVWDRRWRAIDNDRRYALTLRFPARAGETVAEAVGIRYYAPAGGTGLNVSRLEAGFLDRLGRAGALELAIGERRLGRYTLPNAAAAMARLRRCAEQGPPPGAGPANLASYFSRDDYPRAAIRNREEGTVVFRLTVGTDGRVADCTITSSSGSASLDEATCRILRERGRYRPARDARGNPTTGSDEGSVTWALPRR